MTASTGAVGDAIGAQAGLHESPGALAPPIAGDTKRLATAPQSQISKPSIYRYDCINPAGREDADSCQQRRAAQAAEDQYAVSLWGALVSSAAAFFTGWAAIAAASAARAARDSVKLSSDIAERQLRAYVLIERAALSRHPDRKEDFWAIHIIVKNSGQTPAYKMRAKTEKRFIQNGPEIMELSDESMSHPIITIAPGHDYTIRMAFNEFPKSLNLWETFKNEGFRAYVYGRIDYEDAFGKPRFLTFQMVHGCEPIHEFGMCDKGNDAN